MLPMTTRKRKPCTDSDTLPVKKALNDGVKRSSPRKPPTTPVKRKPNTHMDKENSSSQQGHTVQSAHRAPPLRAALGCSSFYGKHTPVYLTPLDRKRIKEALPPPTAPPPQTKNADKKKKKVTAVGMRKSAAGAKNRAKVKGHTSASASMTAAGNSAVAVRPAASTSAVASAPSKSTETKKGVGAMFSSVRPRPRIYVGAAFFSTKKPTSMYKRAAPKTPARTTAQRPPGTTHTQITDRTTQKQNTHVDLQDEPEPPRALSSQNMKSRCSKELKVALTRAPTPSSSTQDGGSDPVLDLSEISATSPPKAVYPIFGSTSKRSKVAALRSPVSCSTPTGSAPNPQNHYPAAKERRRRDKQQHDQLIIDAGQKQFGALTCASCGMVYSADNPDDHIQHTQFHQRFMDSIRYVGWKKERVVAEFWDGKILLVMGGDPKYALKKAEDVRLIVDNELGFQQVSLSRPSHAKTYLFISTQRSVVGCVVAEPIRQAYRVLQQPERHREPSQDLLLERHRAWCCSTTPEPALCGISRIWVFSLARRRGVATRLLDTVRKTFAYGGHLTKEEMAFSDPTPDGQLLATAYCHTPAFLVYNFVL